MLHLILLALTLGLPVSGRVREKFLFPSHLFKTFRIFEQKTVDMWPRGSKGETSPLWSQMWSERENAEYPPLPQFRLQPKGTHDHLPMRTLVSCQTFHLLDRRYTDSQPALTCLPCIQSSLVTQRNQLLQSWPSHLSLCYRSQQAKQTDPAVTWCVFSEP